VSRSDQDVVALRQVLPDWYSRMFTDAQLTLPARQRWVNLLTEPDMPLTRTQRAVAHAIARFMDLDGHTGPVEVDDIASAAAMSSRSVSYAIVRLEQLGFLGRHGGGQHYACSWAARRPDADPRGLVTVTKPTRVTARGLFDDDVEDGCHRCSIGPYDPASKGCRSCSTRPAEPVDEGCAEGCGQQPRPARGAPDLHAVHPDLHAVQVIQRKQGLQEEQEARECATAHAPPARPVAAPPRQPPLLAAVQPVPPTARSPDADLPPDNPDQEATA
jgi:hypothetical protein